MNIKKGAIELPLVLYPRTWDDNPVACVAFYKGAFLLMHTSLNGDYTGIVQAYIMTI